MDFIKVRQGALVITIAPLGDVSYRVVMAIPKDLPIDFDRLGQDFKFNVLTINKRKFITSEEFSVHKHALAFKLSLQLVVQDYKNVIGEQRRVRLLENFSAL